MSQQQLIDNGDGTVTDPNTGLMWPTDTTAFDVTQKDAITACNELDIAGFKDWRIATLPEQFSIADHSRHGPAINTEFFADTRNDWYWTGTPCAWSSDFFWIVSFYSGLVYDYLRDGNACVRAVRSVSPSQ